MVGNASGPTEPQGSWEIHSFIQGGQTPSKDETEKKTSSVQEQKLFQKELSTKKSIKEPSQGRSRSFSFEMPQALKKFSAFFKSLPGRLWRSLSNPFVKVTPQDDSPKKNDLIQKHLSSIQECLPKDPQEVVIQKEGSFLKEAYLGEKKSMEISDQMKVDLNRLGMVLDSKNVSLKLEDEAEGEKDAKLEERRNLIVKELEEKYPDGQKTEDVDNREIKARIYLNFQQAATIPISSGALVNALQQKIDGETAGRESSNRKREISGELKELRKEPKVNESKISKLEAELKAIDAKLDRNNAISDAFRGNYSLQDVDTWLVADTEKHTITTYTRYEPRQESEAPLLLLKSTYNCVKNSYTVNVVDAKEWPNVDRLEELDTPWKPSQEEKVSIEEGLGQLKVDLNRAIIEIDGKLVTAGGGHKICLNDPDKGAEEIQKSLQAECSKEEEARIYAWITQGGVAPIVKEASPSILEKIGELENVQQDFLIQKRNGEDVDEQLAQLESEKQKLIDSINSKNLERMYLLDVKEGFIENYVKFPSGLCKKLIYNYRTDQFKIKTISEEDFTAKQQDLLRKDKPRMFDASAYQS